MTELIAQFIRYFMLMCEFRDQKVYTRGTMPFLHKQFLDFNGDAFLRYKTYTLSIPLARTFQKHVEIL